MTTTPLADAHWKMMLALWPTQPTDFVGRAEACDFRDLEKHMMQFAAIVDEYLTVIGDAAKSNDSGVDVKQFREVLANALQGNATFELDQAARRAEGEVQ